LFNRVLSAEEIQTIYRFEPEGPRPVHLGIRVSHVELCWDTDTSALYQLQYRSELTTNLWVPLFTNYVKGTGSSICTNDAVLVGQPQRYYRVVSTNAPASSFP
jgi:hypothetical protein